MTLRRAALTPVLGMAAAAVLAACGAPAGPPPAAPGEPARLAVVASTDVYGSIVTAVGGDAVQVKSIIHNPDSDPHEYESTPGDAAAVNAAKLVVYNGADYDPFAEELVAQAGSKPLTIDVAELSGLQAAVPAGDEFNEHVWYSLPTVEKLAETVAADLAKLDPARAATFTTNAAAFTAKIDRLQRKVDAIKAEHDGDEVAVTEPVPLYLVEAAGLDNVTPDEFTEGVEEGIDPPAAVVGETLALFRGPDAVQVLLANTQTEDAATKQVTAAATGAGVPIVPVSETLPPGVGDYVTWMTQQVDALAAALDRAA